MPEGTGPILKRILGWIVEGFIHTFMGTSITNEEIAAQACEIEIEVLANPIGKQDQYGCAIGGLKRLSFHPDGAVIVGSMGKLNSFNDIIKNSVLVWTGKARSAAALLEEQAKIKSTITKSYPHGRNVQ